MAGVRPLRVLRILLSVVLLGLTASLLFAKPGAIQSLVRKDGLAGAMLGKIRVPWDGLALGSAKRQGRQRLAHDDLLPVAGGRKTERHDENRRIFDPNAGARTDTIFDGKTDPRDVLRSPFATPEERQTAKNELRGKKHIDLGRKIDARHHSSFDQDNKPIEVLRSPFATPEGRQAAKDELGGKKRAGFKRKIDARHNSPFDEMATPIEVLRSPFATPEQRQATRDELRAGKRVVNKPKISARTDTIFDGKTSPRDVLRSPFATPEQRQAAKAALRAGKKGAKNAARFKGFEHGADRAAKVRFVGRAESKIDHQLGRLPSHRGLRVIKGGKSFGPVTGFALPEQTRFPGYYRMRRSWATGAACKSPRHKVDRRDQVSITYGTITVTPSQPYCGSFAGGATDAQGSPYRSRIGGGLTVEQGSPWRSAIKGGLTVRQGSPWRGTIKGGLTVEQGSRWASHMRNWNFRDYDPARFPSQAMPRRKATTASYRGRLRAGRPVKLRSRWAGRIKSGRTVRGSPWASGTRY